MKCYLFVLATAWPGLVTSHGGHAAEMAGIALNQSVTMNECAVRQHDYLPDERTTCFKLPTGPSRDPYADAPKPPANGRIIVNVSLPDRPGFMSGSEAQVLLRNGLTVSISVRTHGGEAGDFRALKDLFGDASPRHLTVPWNTGGSGPVLTQTGLQADWILPGDETVYFSSGEFGAFLGLVRLQTSAAPAHRTGVRD
ncbi:hypothetical protein ACFPPA_06205 [Rhodanobacter ginsengisoli]|uniref:Uncharacterized protein n=1 Tax=Rhodanobacter ginsengisoli TaxID=418646 RepID=A0ABW0QK73_9GAMM